MSITVQLAHFSDCHSHFDGAPMRFFPVGESEWRTPCGGYARILTRLTALRQQAAITRIAADAGRQLAAHRIGVAAHLRGMRFAHAEMVN